jgi:hypothetical protein
MDMAPFKPIRCSRPKKRLSSFAVTCHYAVFLSLSSLRNREELTGSNLGVNESCREVFGFVFQPKPRRAPQQLARARTAVSAGVRPAPQGSHRDDAGRVPVSKHFQV